MPKIPKKAVGVVLVGGEPVRVKKPKALPGAKGIYDLRTPAADADGAGRAGGVGDEETETFVIGVRLVNDREEPIGEMPSGGPVRFELTVGGETFEGELGDDGTAVVKGLPEKQCEVSFPDIHSDEWRRI
jgi:hypothetical protein